MQKRRSARFVVLATLTAAALLVGSVIATGRLPGVSRAWKDLKAAVTSAVASAIPAPSAPSRSPIAGPSAPSSGRDARAPAVPEAGARPRPQAAPLSSAQLGAPLVHGAFVSACGAPDNMKVVVDVTVKMGRAVKVAARTQPPNAAVASCVEKATRDLQWDISPKADHVTVTY